MTTTRPSPIPSEPSTRPRLRGLDGLRFFAAFAVLLYHFGAFDAYSDAVWGEPVEDVTGDVGVWFGYGALAPSLFFVISGFVILMTAQGRNLRRFIASRVARLYPAYWVAVLATALLLTLLWNPGRNPGLAQVAVNLTMFQSAFGFSHVDGVYWTLWVEMKFYLLMAVFLLFGVTARRALVVATLWPLVAWGFYLAEVPYVWDWLIYRHAPFFAGGMVLFLIHRHGHTLSRWLVLAMNIGLGVLHGVPGLSRQVAERTPHELDPVILGILTVGCFAAVAVLSLTRLKHLGWKWLTVIGGLTYPLYLTHQYWGWWIISMLSDHVPAGVSVLAATAFSMVLAWLLYRFVEKPFGPRLRNAVTRLLDRTKRSQPAPTERSSSDGGAAAGRGPVDGGAAAGSGPADALTNGDPAGVFDRQRRADRGPLTHPSDAMFEPDGRSEDDDRPPATVPPQR